MRFVIDLGLRTERPSGVPWKEVTHFWVLVGEVTIVEPFYACADELVFQELSKTSDSASFFLGAISLYRSKPLSLDRASLLTEPGR